ncbi:MAG: hypothetical protein JW751_14370 [Polyangiaceae bacterium]|nr:hypothetical protein [Polyangiaceae bacterium]
MSQPPSASGTGAIEVERVKLRHDHAYAPCLPTPPPVLNARRHRSRECIPNALTIFPELVPVAPWQRPDTVPGGNRWRAGLAPGAMRRHVAGVAGVGTLAEVAARGRWRARPPAEYPSLVS